MLLEIQHFQSLDLPTIQRFSQNRMERFFQQNANAIRHLQSKTRAILEEHVEKNDGPEQSTKGIYKFQKQVVDIGDSSQQVMMPVFIDEQHGVEYKKKWDELMTKTVGIEI